jgi:hypothetical protein
VQAAIVSDPAKSFGLAARVQGLTRYYALLLGPNQVLRLVRNHDGAEVLAEVPYTWNWSQRYNFNLEVNGPTVTGSLNGTELIRYHDHDGALLDGGIALVCEEGLIVTDEVSVTAVARVGILPAPRLRRAQSSRCAPKHHSGFWLSENAAVIHSN